MFKYSDKLDMLTNGKHDYIVIPVNCVGVMGAGLAKQCAKEFPFILPIYKEHCRTGRMKKECFIVEHNNNGPDIILIATKDHWSNMSLSGMILQGVRRLSEFMDTNEGHVGLPKLGCGLGRLSWKYDVLPMITEHLAKHSDRILIY